MGNSQLMNFSMLQQQLAVGRNQDRRVEDGLRPFFDQPGAEVNLMKSSDAREGGIIFAFRNGVSALRRIHPTEWQCFGQQHYLSPATRRRSNEPRRTLHVAL